MHSPKAMDSMPPAECPRRFSECEAPPSTRELVKLLVADPTRVPVWEESDRVWTAGMVDFSDPDTKEARSAAHSESRALLGFVIHGFAQELDDFRAANPPFGLRDWKRGSCFTVREAVRPEDAQPNLDWVSRFVENSTLDYLGEFLRNARENDTPHAKAIKRLDETLKAFARRRHMPIPQASYVEQDELQSKIHGGLNTAADVNKQLLLRIEELVRETDPEADAAIIASAARNSYRLPLGLARLSISSVFSFDEFLGTNQHFTLHKKDGTMRVGFAAPPDEIFSKLSDIYQGDPTALGCPANVKIGARMIN